MGTVRAYLGLTKTRIIEQLLVVTVPAMFLAQRGIPSLWLICATLLGGAAAAASAHALNCVVDADIDKVMKRTARRPLAKGQVAPRNALVFGLVLGASSSVWLGLTTNWLAAALSVAAIAFYVLVYTLLLKRRTAQNIVWGGAAGCMPVVIGWAAVTGTVQWPALVMFGVIFFWTPPHFWALAMRYREDYAAAGVPMLPVVATAVQVSRRILIYSWVMAGGACCWCRHLVDLRGGGGARRGGVRPAGPPAAPHGGPRRRGAADAAVPPVEHVPVRAVRRDRRRCRGRPAAAVRLTVRPSAESTPGRGPFRAQRGRRWGQAGRDEGRWGSSTYILAAPPVDLLVAGAGRRPAG
jgi:protoheme IX farnesyltransferase